MNIEHSHQNSNPTVKNKIPICKISKFQELKWFSFITMPINFEIRAIMSFNSVKDVEYHELDLSMQKKFSRSFIII